MKLTRETMDALFRGFQNSLNKGLGKTDENYKKFSTEINSTGAIESYPISFVQTKLKKWIGSRQINKIDAKKFDVRNQNFENTIEVDRDDIADDNINFYGVIFEEQGYAAAQLWGDLAIEALLNPGTWADGGKFFKSNRVINKKVTINNVVNETLSGESYDKARNQMAAFTDAGGNSLNLRPTIIVVGPKNERKAKRMFEAETIVENGVAVDNIRKGEVEVVVDNRFVGEHADKWFLMCADRPVKPVTVQKRQAVTMTRQDKEDHDCVFKKNKNLYGMKARGASCLTLPHLIIGGKVGS